MSHRNAAYKCQRTRSSCVRCERQGDLVKKPMEEGLCCYGLSAVSWHWIKKQRMASKVDRCHTIPHNKPYTVGQHSFSMQFIALELLGEMLYNNPRAQLDILKHCMTHDLPEVHVGDVPAPVKKYEGVKETFDNLEDEWYDRNLPAVFKSEGNHGGKAAIAMVSIVKLADMFEYAFHCMEEIQTGNEYFWESMTNIFSYITEVQTGPRPFEEFALYVDQRTFDLYVAKIAKFIKERKGNEDATSIFPKDCR